MFSNPIKPDSTHDEATVTEVDSVRGSCKVITLSGRTLTNVKWLQPSGGSGRSGDRIPVTMGDRVVVNTSLGYPLILGFLPKVQTSDLAFPLSIDTGETLLDTGNFGPGGTQAIGDQSKPLDALSGDRVIGSFGGGMIAMLRAGSILLRSSRLSEIFISKLDDMVRIVSRNWAHYTDASSDVIRNISGRVYRYTGYAATFSDAKNEAYSFHQYAGDTALAEANKAGTSGSAMANSIVYKEQITSSAKGAATELMHRTIDLKGNEELYVTGEGGFVRILVQGGVATISVNDKNSIVLNASAITSSFEGGNTSTITSDTISLVHSSGASTTLKSSGVYNTFGAHFANVTSSGVQLG